MGGETPQSTTPQLHKEVEPASLADDTNPRSIINLLPPVIRERVREAMQKYPDYFNCAESELYRKLKADCNKIQVIDNVLRMKFWFEYERCQSHGLPGINFNYIISGIITRDFFYNGYVRSPARLAWLLCPPVAYIARLEEIHAQALTNFSEVMLQRPVDEEGNVDHKLVNDQLKIFQVIDEKLHGTKIQRHEHKVESRSIVATVGRDVVRAGEEVNVLTLEKKLAQLEAENKLLSHLPTAEELQKPEIVFTMPSEHKNSWERNKE